MTLPVSALLSLRGPVRQLDESIAAKLALYGRTERFDPDEVVLRADDEATHFHIVVSGIVLLGLSVPGKPDVVIQSLGEGDLAGLSWYYPPYRWRWDVRAITDVSTLAFDVAAVRSACADDRDLDLAIVRLLAREMHDRLAHTRLQMLDIYAAPGSP